MFVHLFVCLFLWRTGRANLYYRIKWNTMRHGVVREFEPARQHVKVMKFDVLLTSRNQNIFISE